MQNSAKFRGNIKIPRLGWKFPYPQTTVSPTDDLSVEKLD